jgi:hypothetical protein
LRFKLLQDGIGVGAGLLQQVRGIMRCAPA